MTVCGHRCCFGTKWQYPWAEISVGCKPDLICVGEPVNQGLERQFPVVQLPDTVLDGLFGAVDHRRRGRCPSPSELTGTCIFDLRLPINGS
jgi:hypothetical protein